MTSAELGGARIKRGLLWRLFGIANLFRRFCCRIVWFCFWLKKQFRLSSSSSSSSLLLLLLLACLLLLRRFSWYRRLTGADYRHLPPLERGFDCWIITTTGFRKRNCENFERCVFVFGSEEKQKP